MAKTIQGGAMPKRDDGGIETKPLFTVPVSTKMLWVLGGICITVTGGAAAAGGFVQKMASEIGNLSKDREISRLTGKVEGLERGVDFLKTKLEEQIGHSQALETKGELLNRLVGYLQGKDEVSKTLLVNVVCSMWKESEKKKIRLQQERIQIRSEDIKYGRLDPEIESLLVSRGVSSQTLAIAQTVPPRGVELRRQNLASDDPVLQRQLRAKDDPVLQRELRARDEAVGEVMKYASDVQVIKIVSFPDGTRYQLPQEIATTVHLKPECAPL